MKKILLPFIFLLPICVNAGGFQLNTASVKGLSMSGLNTGFCKDASTVFFNPGAMGSLDKKFNISVGGCFTMPSTSYLSPYNGNVDMNNQNLFPYHIYGTYKINKKLAVGISINNPFGFHTKWNDDWEGRYIVQETSLNAAFIQPAISYAITKKISIGAGFIFASGKFYRRFAYENVGASDINVDMKASATGYGFNIGAYFKLSEKATLGIDYRSKIKMDYKNGDATFTNVPGSLFNNPYPSTAKYNTEVTLPTSFNAGLTYQLNDKALIGMELNYTGWSDFDSLNFLFPDNPELDSRGPRNYRNVVAARIGAQYKVTEKIPVRIGVAYDQSPVQDGYVSPALPDADKVILSAGASYILTKKISLDFAYSFESYKERMASYDAVEFKGTYKTSVNNFALAINFIF